MDGLENDDFPYFFVGSFFRWTSKQPLISRGSNFNSSPTWKGAFFSKYHNIIGVLKFNPIWVDFKWVFTWVPFDKNTFVSERLTRKFMFRCSFGQDRGIVNHSNFWDQTFWAIYIYILVYIKTLYIYTVFRYYEYNILYRYISYTWVIYHISLLTLYEVHCMDLFPSQYTPKSSFVNHNLLQGRSPCSTKKTLPPYINPTEKINKKKQHLK